MIKCGLHGGLHIYTFLTRRGVKGEPGRGLQHLVPWVKLGLLEIIAAQHMIIKRIYPNYQVERLNFEISTKKIITLTSLCSVLLSLGYACGSKRHHWHPLLTSESAASPWRPNHLDEQIVDVRGFEHKLLIIVLLHCALLGRLGYF